MSSLHPTLQDYDERGSIYGLTLSGPSETRWMSETRADALLGAGKDLATLFALGAATAGTGGTSAPMTVPMMVAEVLLIYGAVHKAMQFGLLLGVGESEIQGVNEAFALIGLKERSMAAASALLGLSSTPTAVNARVAILNLAEKALKLKNSPHSLKARLDFSKAASDALKKLKDWQSEFTKEPKDVGRVRNETGEARGTRLSTGEGRGVTANPKSSEPKSTPKEQMGPPKTLMNPPRGRDPLPSGQGPVQLGGKG